MRYSVFILIIAACLLWASPVLAYDTPTQSSDNATDVIIWHGDTPTVNVSISEIDDLTVSVDSLNDTISSFIPLLIMFGIAVVAFWKDSLIIYAISVVPLIVYGLSYAAGADDDVTKWVLGVVLVILGIHNLYKTVGMAITEIKTRR